MKLSQCFIQTFQNILLNYGFKRKGVLFYRIHGDILQGIKLKQTNPYSIMIMYYPYWMHQLIYPDEFYSDLKKGYWAERGEYINGQYYSQDDPDQNQKNMTMCLETVCNEVLPVLERVTNTKSYLQATLESYQNSVNRLNQNLEGGNTATISDESICKILYHQITSQYALLFQALEDRSFEFADTIWQEYQKVLDAEKQYHIRDLAETGKDISTAMEDKMKKNIQLLFSVWIQKRAAGDIEWIAGVYENESTKMRQALHTDLKLTIY